MNIKITLVKSPIGYEKSQAATVRALGLHRLGSSAIQEGTPAVRGMVRKIRHLIQVQETDLPTQKAKRRERAARAAKKPHAPAGNETQAKSAVTPEVPASERSAEAKVSAKAPAEAGTKAAPGGKAPRKPADRAAEAKAKPAPKSKARASGTAAKPEGAAKKAAAKAPAARRTAGERSKASRGKGTDKS